MLLLPSALGFFGGAPLRAGSAVVSPTPHAAPAGAPVMQRPLPFAPALSSQRTRVASIRAVAMEPAPAVSGSGADLASQMESYVRARSGSRVIRRILIANNGMASTKTIMSIRNWAYNTFGDERAIQFVVMATPEDLAANAEFIRRADDFVEVPGGSNVNNYANVQLIVDLCISQNVDAVMVGWGHASENPKLGDLLQQRSAELGREITFIGPSSDVMRILGDKIGSTLVAQSAGVSCMPWNGDGLPAGLDENNKIPQSKCARHAPCPCALARRRVRVSPRVCAVSTRRASRPRTWQSRLPIASATP